DRLCHHASLLSRKLELHWDEPRLDAFEFVSRKLPQNAVLYDVLGLHMPASVAPSAGQRPRHGNRTRRIAPAAETYTRQLCPFFVLYKRGSTTVTASPA